MSENDDTRDQSGTVVCHVCGKEIPQSAARNAEGRDYSYFFCGAGCYQRWSANRHADHEGVKHQ